MTTDPKQIGDSVNAFFATHALDDSPLRLVPGSSDWTEEQWAAHDAKIAAKRAEDDRQAIEQRRKAHLAECHRQGFPLRAVEAAERADETASALVKVAAWKHDDESILVLSGPAGCGKTVAATWWALRFHHMPKFLRATAFAASSRYDQEKRDEWLQSNALVLDDLGTEYADAKGNYLVDLDELIDTFYGNRKPLLITTNCNAADFKKRYGERITDRVRECGTFFETRSKSLRGRP